MFRLARLSGAALALLILPLAALAQGLVQGGPFQYPTPGHPAYWVYNGILGDAGGPANGQITGLGISAPGTPFCMNSVPPPPGGAPPTGAFYQFCLGANATINGQQGSYLTINGYGGAPQLPLYWNYYGTNYQFPFTVGGILGPSMSTISDAVCWNNTIGSLVADCGFPPAGIVLTNAALQALSLPTGATTWRFDYATGNGAPPLLFTATASPCSLNSGNGDNGSQVKMANGNCAVANFTSHTEADPMEWGAVCNGTTNDYTPLQAAINYGLNVAIPAGKTCATGSQLVVTTAGQYIESGGRGLGELTCIGSSPYDCVEFEGTGGPPATNAGGGVRNLQISNAALGDDFSVFFNGFENGQVENVFFDGAGMIKVTGTQTQTTLRDVFGQTGISGATVGSNKVAIYEYAGTGQNANGLAIFNVTLGCDGNNVIALLLNGNANTTTGDTFKINNCGIGVQTENTLGVSGAKPSFYDVANTEVQTPLAQCFNLLTGNNLRFERPACLSSGADGMDVASVVNTVIIHAPEFNNATKAGIDFQGNQLTVFGGYVMNSNTSDTGSCSDFTGSLCPNIGIGAAALGGIAIDNVQTAGANVTYNIDIAPGATLPFTIIGDYYNAVRDGTGAAKIFPAGMEAGLTAAGSSQGTALALNCADNLHTVTTVSAGTGVVLCSIPNGRPRTDTIVNGQATNPLLVYPPSGGAFFGYSTNAALTLPGGNVLQVTYENGISRIYANFAQTNIGPTNVVHVSALPSCSAALEGYIYVVNDASSPTYNGTLTGGSTSFALAVCNGTNWVAH